MLCFLSIAQASTSKESQPSDIIENGTADDVGQAPKKPVKKKKVSFNFGLETSDDTHIVKKEPNAALAPIVPIIKKECLPSAIRIARGESVIKPSRLSGLTQFAGKTTKPAGDERPADGSDAEDAAAKRSSDDATDSDADDPLRRRVLSLGRDIDINKKLLKKNGLKRSKSHKLEPEAGDSKAPERNGWWTWAFLLNSHCRMFARARRFRLGFGLEN